MYTGKTLAPDVVYIMAFVDFMSSMCFPVVVRLYIGRKMVGKPHVTCISPEVTNQLNEVDLGAHYTLDLCFLDGIFCLMKTSTMSAFKRFSVSVDVKQCFSKQYACDLDIIRKFWVV